MHVKNTIDQYGLVAKLLHWAIFILLVFMLTLGFLLGDFFGEYRHLASNVHKVTGVCILFLMLFRLIWRWSNPKPATLPDTPVWQRIAEKVVHYSLYALVFTMPIVGWIGSSSAGKAPHFGDWVWALPIDKDKPLIRTMFDIHDIVAWVLIGFISIHILAALYHYFIKRDSVMQRML